MHRPSLGHMHNQRGRSTGTLMKQDDVYIIYNYMLVWGGRWAGNEVRKASSLVGEPYIT